MGGSSSDGPAWVSEEMTREEILASDLRLEPILDPTDVELSDRAAASSRRVDRFQSLVQSTKSGLGSSRPICPQADEPNLFPMAMISYSVGLLGGSYPYPTVMTVVLLFPCGISLSYLIQLVQR